MTSVAVLLAAGGASRFRRSADASGLAVSHKLLAPLRGRTVFATALDNALEAGFATLVVVTGSIVLPIPMSVGETTGAHIEPRIRTTSLQFIHNPEWAQGQATSLACAIDWIKQHHPEVTSMVVGLGDQPFIPPQAWRDVAEVAIDCPIVVATYNGKRRNPVRIARALWDEIPRTGDEGARPLLRLHPQLVTEVACQGNPADIDTAEDLLKWS
jgi:molybdenum cofactor cytidylyltransferase